ncbi:hypothetical protein L1987_60518 [Smallanthus sonchifolius]|uniref:Uncharacterized protein n=1 Tax=Smallanthus sonchifolius TaxID=185202 RepID=A0ACB9D8B6_9ASTR|nr:hypothetical protein L1987_60518 [Smallanthus sonchifolius]
MNEDTRVNSGPPPPRREESYFGGPREGGRGGRSFDNTNRVYVGNLAWSVDNLALETLFREQGNVLEAKVVYDMESGRPRGFMFVTYNSTDEVNDVIDSLNGVDLDGRNIRVSVAEAHKCISFKKLKGVMRCNMLQYKEESDAYCEAVTTYILYDHIDGGFMKDGFFASINVGVWWWWWYTLLHRNKSEEQAYVSAWW